ncbi:MAG: asparagine synthetase B [Nanoarchaeota archaeon]|nr:asparagine synthetase B [Nanoarchaeota archaeon]
MCGILGFFSNSESNFLINNMELLKKQIYTISHRGDDGFGVLINEDLLHTQSFDIFKSYLDLNLNKNLSSDLDSNLNIISILTHYLHSIEGFTIQPLVSTIHNSSFVFNGEIYNYKDLIIEFGIEFEKIDNKKISGKNNDNLDEELFNDSNVLFEILNSFEEEFVLECIQKLLLKLSGDFACVYKRGNKVYAFRDVLGVKPLWFDYNEKDKCIIFTSERNSFKDESYFNFKEVLPSEIIMYDINSSNLEIVNRDESYELNLELMDEIELIERETFKLLKEAVKKRIPLSSTKKVGLLFSGGVDSTVLALILKELGIDFTCYSAHLVSNSLDIAEDYVYSVKIAQKYNLDLKVNTIEIHELEELIKKTIRIIDDRDYIKVSVALPFVASCELAQRDEIDVMFSGLGSEEIFAGYRRHKQAQDVNLECLKGLQILHTRDLYRDDVITMNFGQELRVPFLDKELIRYCLQIPAKYKLDLDMVKLIEDDVYKNPHLNSQVRSKIVLRDIAMKYLHLEEEFANRQKKAAQYGSKFDKGILRLSKDKGLMKQEYLYNLLN